MARHAFPRRFVDAPSIQPERIPAHRAPMHRAERHEDSCGLVCGANVFGPTCEQYAGSRRVVLAEERAS